MTPADWVLFLKMAGSAGFGVLVMGMALRWLDKDRRDNLALLAKEREARILVLEGQATRCAEDRASLHKEISSLQAEVRALLHAQIKLAAFHGEDAVPEKK